MNNMSVLKSCLAALIVLALQACSGASTPPPQPEAPVAATPASAIQQAPVPETLPHFNVQDASGNTIDLQSYRGKTVFINLWASWCGPCRAEMPHISDLYDAVKDTPDLEFLMIGLDQNKQKSQEFMEGKSWSFPVVHASYGLNNSLQSESIPTTLVVNKEGKIVFYQQGMSNFNTEEFKTFLQSQ